MSTPTVTPPSMAPPAAADQPPVWQRVAAAFDGALELPEQERGTFVERVCSSDPEVLATVRRLLTAHARQGILDRPRGHLPAPLGTPAPAVDRDSRIGSYSVIRALGSGGMGDVYLAERTGEGFHQRVAIKVLRLSTLDDGEALARRFLAERSILARLEHPNIPRFLDGGLTAEGAPYFAMEYVEGMAIDQYCDINRLSLRQRLALLTSVCDAIQYAHQHLVVHRDLKPSNILVTPAGAVKVLDFGIAKILDADADAQSQTGAGQRWMTPEYASPEQVRGDVVTTATDVFALGIVLYELVACRRPYVGRSRYEVERSILESDPALPSAALPSVMCVGKGFEPSALRRELAGDVDMIAIKALNKDARRRYQTAGELADDIRRYLAGLPVLARPDTLAYRTGKFIERHRWLVTVVAIGLVTTIAGVVTTAIAASAARRHGLEAAAERDRATQVSRFAVELFQGVGAGNAQGRAVTAKELLDSGTARVRRDTATPPDLRASMLGVLAQSYAGLGFIEEAETVSREASALRVPLRSP